MAKKDEVQWLNSLGQDGYKKVDENAIDDVMTKRVAVFLSTAQQLAIDYDLIGDGNLTSSKGYKTKTQTKGGLTTIEIYLIYYGLFQDRGVQGYQAKYNAPKSPYKFRHKYMSEDGLQSIKNMITKGRAKIRNVEKYEKVGFERKTEKIKETKDTLTKQAEDIAANIKKYGIKTKPFFRKAFEKVFGKLDYEMVEAVKKQIITRLQMKNKQ